VYGPFSYHKQSVVAEFLKRALRRQPLRIDGDGSQVRDFLYVEDLCRAIALALSRDVAGEVFQVASGEGTSILELGRRVAGVAGGEVRCEHHPARPGDVPISLSQVTKSKSELGWEPSVGLDQGLRLTWEWFEAWHRRQAQGAAAG
jgi:UDP-glucose 4-epimerase